MASLHRLSAGLCISLLLLHASIGAAEIYRWTDANGQVHFTQDLGSIPRQHRAEAEARSKRPAPARRRIQTYEPSAPASPSPRARSALRGASQGAASNAGEIYEVRVQRAGNALRVSVLINGTVSVPFLIDTGATDVVLPKWAADELELDLSNARTGVYRTANGVVKQKLVRLESVSMGGAEVKSVPATISDTMSTGLLGLSYFNHFKYDVDPVQGLVTLRRNNLAETGVLKGGRSRRQWQSHFRLARKRIERAEEYLEEVPFGRSRQRARVQEEIERLEQELALLESEADDARIPFSWRE